MTLPRHLPPSAASLTASLRDLGYSLESAIADLVDNSISADASEVAIFLDISRDDPALAVIDDGEGMTEAEVVAAMRHGSTSPRASRSSKDLGRFGLGLKTASFSQARRLTVVSAKHGRSAGARWDLAKVEEQDDWFLEILDHDEILAQPFHDMLGETGTLVIWQDLDRLLEGQVGPRRSETRNEKLSLVERHLSLVFHRFLAGEVRSRRKLTILLNGHQIAPFDPFCRQNPATQILPKEAVWVDGALVSMQPYILPHHSRLTASEHDFYQDRSEFVANQGAYVYRNARLMAWGDWFRLAPKGEATKLARVQIDFPNSLDEAWTIDIKKSRARPPQAVRERLRQIIDRIVSRSVAVHRGRGQKLFDDTRSPVWNRYPDHHGIHYAINREHPLVASVAGQSSPEGVAALGDLLASIAASLPIEMIYSDYSTNPQDVCPPSSGDDKAVELLGRLRKALFGNDPGDRQTFMQFIRSTHLLDGQMDLVEKFADEVFS